ncbi:restriction endonuclease subunit S [Rhodanobacter sp. B2A1Ga4]|uniref:restriction endonuclease subunit S n=1 Tax=Rhodanobacter TaxID=75309 RepID=UPI00131ED849|nr:restriction endonuclease subunit S [Rhodanobacter thiooxydans]MBQ4853509.1 restriction endonuclease subunit S [Rhodanobacter sp. B2A1Ga4]
MEWLGKLPDEWASMKVRLSLLEPPCYGVLVPDFQVDGVPMMRITDIQNGIVARADLVTISEELSNQYRRTIVQAGDVLLSVVGTIGEVVLVDESLAGVNISRAIARLQVAPRIDRFYLAWVLRSDVFNRYVDLVCVGSAQRVLNMSDLSAFMIPVPPPRQQSAIAAFLDRETGKIDALIAEQEKLLTLLAEKRQATISHAVTRGLNPNAPMKDSGVPWLGEVPERWDVVRLGSVYKEVAELGNDELPILSVSIHDGVSDKELDDAEMDRKVTRSDDRSKYKRVAPNDLTYNMMRAWQGGFGTVIVHGQVSPAYVVARPLGDVRTMFVEQLLRTPQAIEQVRRYSRGITEFRLRLYWEEFKNLRIALPQVAEQDEILSAVTSEIAAFNRLAGTVESAITLLKERRSALIAAAVTGKIDVRRAA